MKLKLLIVSCLFIGHAASAQTIHLGSDVFTYNGFSVYHYGLGWYSDPAASPTYGPMAYLSAFGGLKFFTLGTPRGVWDVNGNLGVGTLTPVTRLDVTGNIHVAGGNSNTYSSVQGSYIGWNKSGFQGEMNLVNSIGVGTGGFVFDNTSDGTNFTRLLTILGNGYVGIGTATPQEALSVNGNLRARQVKVETNNWPDFVFHNQYKLTPLDSVERFIGLNQHLEGVPSAEEVTAEGVNLGEMNKILLRKVEELTLYVIQQHKEINSLKRSLTKHRKTGK